jgi:cytochrome b
MATESLSETGGAARIWDLPTRLFHWLFAALIVFAYISAEEGNAMNQWHMIAGYCVTVLLVFRVAWGFVGGEYARFASFLKLDHLATHIGQMLRLRVDPTAGHNPLGGLAVLLMLLLAGGTVLTGIVLNGEEPHEDFGKVMIILAAVHVMAVFVMSRLSRENLPRAMVTGKKAVSPTHPWKDGRGATAWGWILALALSAASVAAILANDPRAFSPRPTESHAERQQGDAFQAGDPETDED